MFQAPFNCKRILCKNKSEKVRVLTWTNFDSFPNTYILKVACFKNFLLQRGWLSLIFSKYKKAWTTFQVAGFQVSSRGTTASNQKLFQDSEWEGSILGPCPKTENQIERRYLRWKDLVRIIQSWIMVPLEKKIQFL